MKTIIVPYDFTQRSEFAIQHAMLLGAPMKAKIVMLTIIGSVKQKEKKTKLLEKAKEKYQYAHALEAEVITGDLVESINKYAEYTRAFLIVLGTINPPQGIEKLFGSQTLKIVRGGDTPCIVVRGMPLYDTLQKIILPISFDYTNKEKLRWVNILSSYFNFDVELFIQNDKNQNERIKVKANYLFFKRYLDRYNIKRKTSLAPPAVPFREALINHAQNSGTDIILIMTSSYLSVVDHLIGSDEEFVICNEYKIPVMCINPNTNLLNFADIF